MESKSKVKVISLGGLGEIGKNITAIEYGNEIVVIDCGMAFPDEEMYGIDIVIPDITYLINNRDKVKGFFLTHGHEDHIGALPYILKQINVPLYGTKLTLGLVESKLQEHNILSDCELNVVKPGDIIKVDNMSVEFIRTNHSIADSCSLAISTPLGVIFHTGDFKVDYTPIDGEIINLERYSEIGKKGVLLLMADSTNAERIGYTMSEKTVGKKLENIFYGAKGRVIVATFASNIHRIQQIVDSSVKQGRKVAFSGRSMEKISQVALELGYLNIQEDVLIGIDDIYKYPNDKVTIVTTGSQGEPMSGLSRIAAGTHRKLRVESGDLFIISASPIPGNEKSISNVINELCRRGAEVIYSSLEDIHVSGHACQEELKLVHRLLKPKYFIPIHGEYRHLKQHAILAEKLGLSKSNIFILDIGETFEITSNKAHIANKVPSGRIMVDGLGVGDVGNIVLRDRKHLSQDGIITIVVTIDKQAATVISGPDIVSRGFIYMKESEDLLRDAKHIVRDSLDNCLSNKVFNWSVIKSSIRSDLGEFLYKKTRRKPLILPVIMEI
ncbi:ribonuclease J [Clostridium frigidicarnis]|uniref:Ribonuclease J n=1 Tax=Clostridium frigidicarnis TaxID=84698 RepID=A0A1I1B897_9CLOT|nr:ribonuclease J [Clostridium frigidicarnis]SFB46579.1 ribonuclease J [Clostridium frigidicarnis]